MSLPPHHQQSVLPWPDCAWVMRSSRKHFIQTLIFKHSFKHIFSHPNYESNTHIMSHTSYPSISIAVYHTALSFFLSRFNLFSIFLLLFSLHLFLTVSFHVPPSLSLYPFLWFNNWCETFCLSSAGWGGLRDMTRLWRALCTTTDTHTDTHILLSSNKGQLYCINVERVLGVCVCI